MAHYTPSAQIGTVPLCKDCVHFIKNDAFSEDSAGRVNFGYCAVYGSVNVVSGERFYEYASLVRDNDNKCGIAAKHYEEAGKATEEAKST